MTAAELQTKVLQAIRGETAKTPLFETYDVESARLEDVGDPTRQFLRVVVKLEEGKALDDRLEGSWLNWSEPTKGSASILVVDVMGDALILNDVRGVPPTIGAKLYVPLPDFLEPLADAWGGPMAEDAALVLERLERAVPEPSGGNAVPSAAFPRLRDAQRGAFELPRFVDGFLWGPPGTGKTTTLGCLLAAYLIEKPGSRVLLLSATNRAVDQALLAVDEALPAAGDAEREIVVSRIGERFEAKEYEGREHLIPQKNKAPVRALIEHLRKEPEKSDLVAYEAWAKREDELRAEVYEATAAVIEAARLSAMTTAKALADLDVLADLRPFDLVVFDESSQVNLASALVLAALGRTCLYAGDRNQLAPITRTNAYGVADWLGRSVFDVAFPDTEQAHVAFLDEQSRMAEPICDLVSGVFYGGKLFVAKDAFADRAWLSARELAVGEYGVDDHAVLVEVPDGPVTGRTFKSAKRNASVELVAGIAEAAARTRVGGAGVVVLTTFRAQRMAILRELRKRGVKGVRVTTVHAAQGAEAPVVLFDPVDGGHQMYQNDPKAADRLINVALSRAQAKLFVFLSPRDRACRTLARIERVLQHDPAPGGQNLLALAGGEGFPANAVGQDVWFQSGSDLIEGKVLGVEGGKLVIFDARSAAERKFSVEFLRGRAGERPQHTLA